MRYLLLAVAMVGCSARPPSPAQPVPPVPVASPQPPAAGSPPAGPTAPPAAASQVIAPLAPVVELDAAQRAAQLGALDREGDDALATGDRDRALARSREALAIDPEHLPALRRAARVHMGRGEPELAQFIIDRAVATDAGAKDATCQMLAGMLAEQLGNPGAARAAYQRATELDPNYFPALVVLGGLDLQSGGDPAAAVELLERAARLRPDSAVALTALGTALRINAGNLADEPGKAAYRRAEGLYRKAIAVDATYAPARYNLGILYLDVELFGLFVDRLQRALQLFAEYKSMIGTDPVALENVDRVTASAQKALARERKRLEREELRRQREQERKQAPPP